MSEGERREDFGLLGKAPDALLREDELTVRQHVELALRALDDARLDAVPVQRGRETRGPSVVAASDGAVVDLDGHAASLPIQARAMPVDDRGEVEAGRERPVDGAAAAQA